MATMLTIFQIAVDLNHIKGCKLDFVFVFGELRHNLRDGVLFSLVVWLSVFLFIWSASMLSYLQGYGLIRLIYSRFLRIIESELLKKLGNQKIKQSWRSCWIILLFYFYFWGVTQFSNRKLELRQNNLVLKLCFNYSFNNKFHCYLLCGHKKLYPVIKISDKYFWIVGKQTPWS